MLPGGPTVGHQACVQRFFARKMEAEREQREKMVKIARQEGAAGPVDITKAQDAVANSTPLEQPAKFPDEGTSLFSAPNPGLPQPASEPHQFSPEEQQQMEAFKQRLLNARAGKVTEEVGKALAAAEQAMAALRMATVKLMDAYDQAVAERDQARGERDTARAVGG
jgi:hypothetical protein